MFIRFRKSIQIANLNLGLKSIVQGSVVAFDPILLPQSKVKCIYYDTLIESYKTGPRGRGRPMWFVDRIDLCSCKFVVEDDSGSILINCPSKNLTVSNAHHEVGTLGNHGLQRYKTNYIQVGDKVRVQGIISKGIDHQDKEVQTIVPDKKQRLHIYVY